jgi:hypothetical protein
MPVMKVLNVFAGQSWTYRQNRKRRVVVIGGTDDTIQIREAGILRVLSFRYFVRAFRPIGARYRYT